MSPRTFVYTSGCCAACNHPISVSQRERAREGQFLVVTPDCLVQLRARICASCLAHARPGNLAEWYVRDAELMPLNARAAGAPSGCSFSHSRAWTGDSTRA
jgi:hypothetical protein